MSDKRSRILIVDDQPAIQAVIKGLLLQDGYDLEFCSSGSETLARLDEFKPDTILLDVMMPDMDGFEVCERLKADERWRHIPIIMITALDSKEDMARGFDAGADDFLSKPVNSLELRARVRSMLRIKKQFDELQTTMQLREDLTAMIVHDIRNPLAPIMGIAELLLLKGELSPQATKDIQTLRSEAHRLNDYIDDMLMLTKTEQEGLILSCETVDIKQLVWAVSENYQVVARSKNVDLITDFSDGPQAVWLDAHLFQRVLDNLISNALKFSPLRSCVTIATEDLDRPKTGAEIEVVPTSRALLPGEEDQSIRDENYRPGLRLKVIDEGPGIPEMYRRSVFDKFKIVDLKAQHIRQTGLGLAFCKMVVEAHGGEIFVESNTPQGAIFTIEI